MEYSLDVMEEIENLRKEERIAKAKQEAKKIFYKGRYEALPFIEKKLIYMLFREIIPYSVFYFNYDNILKSYDRYILYPIYTISIEKFIKFNEKVINILEKEKELQPENELVKISYGSVTKEQLIKKIDERVTAVKKFKYSLVNTVKDYFNVLILKNKLSEYKEKQVILKKLYQEYPFMEIYTLDEIFSEYEKSEKEYKENL
jgi:hypothetical protein